MATQTLTTTHGGLERVLRASEAFVVLVKAAVREARALAAERRNDEQMLEIARTDPRLMAELRAAKARAEVDHVG